VSANRRPEKPTAGGKSSAEQKSVFARYRTAILATVAVLGVLVIGLIFFQSSTAEAYTCDSLLTPPPSQSLDQGFPTTYLGNQHVNVGTTIRYGFCPPTSGSHYSSGTRGPIPAAVYAPSSEQAPGGWVHNLEHGWVVALYRCPSGTPGQGDCASNDEMATLQQWFNDAPTSATCGRQALVARFDSMTTRFAVLAWNRALLVDDFNLSLASNFADTWTDVTASEPDAC
jgi:hypothetical protein